jgi:hypothetical protein
MVIDCTGNEHSTGVGQGFDSRRNVDAISKEIVALDDHVTEIDADTEFSRE